MKKEEKRELLRLKRENARLKRENEYLNHRLQKFSPREEKNISEEKELFISSGDIDKCGGYFRYLFARFKLSLVYRVYDRAFFAVRKLILASRIWRYLPVALGALGSVLQAILTLGSVVVLLPVSAAASFAFMCVSLVSFARQRKKLLAKTAGARIFFLYPSKKPRENGAFWQSAQILSREGMVFAVTDSFRLCGFGAVKKRGENIYVIHTSFYYTFEPAAAKNADHVTKIF